MSDVVVIGAVACLKVDQHAGKGFELAIAEDALVVRISVCNEMLDTVRLLANLWTGKDLPS